MKLLKNVTALIVLALSVVACTLYAQVGSSQGQNQCDKCIENSTEKPWSDSVYCETVFISNGTPNPQGGSGTPCSAKVCVKIRECAGRYEVKIVGIENPTDCDNSTMGFMSRTVGALFNQNKFSLYDNLIIPGQRRNIRIQKQNCWKKVYHNGSAIYLPCRDQPCCITDFQQIGQTPTPQCSVAPEQVFYDYREYDAETRYPKCAEDTMVIDQQTIAQFSITGTDFELLQLAFLNVSCHYVCTPTNPRQGIELRNGKRNRVIEPGDDK
jgi:hypothetical protein